MVIQANLLKRLYSDKLLRGMYHIHVWDSNMSQREVHTHQLARHTARAPTLALVADHSGVEGAFAGVGGATELTRGILGAGDAVASVGAWKAHRHIGTQA